MPFTADQLAQVRRFIAQRQLAVNYSKPVINSALTAVDDWFDANQASLVTAINASTAPLVLSGPQKIALVAAWLQHRLGVS